VSPVDAADSSLARGRNAAVVLGGVGLVAVVAAGAPVSYTRLALAGLLGTGFRVYAGAAGGASVYGVLE
jgi:hypothetical protein